MAMIPQPIRPCFFGLGQATIANVGIEVIKSLDIEWMKASWPVFIGGNAIMDGNRQGIVDGAGVDIFLADACFFGSTNSGSIDFAGTSCRKFTHRN